MSDLNVQSNNRQNAGVLGDFVLTLACPDRPGIVHAVTTFLMEHGGNIRESQQFGDLEHGRFFMRIGFETAAASDAETLREAFAATAEQFAMTYELWSARTPLPHADHGLQAAALPQRPAVPHHDGRPPDRSTPHRLQPPRRRAPGEVLRHRLRAHPGHARHQGAGRGSADEAGRRARHRPGGAGPLHADPLRRPVPQPGRRARSTSTTPSCRASRAPSPTTRPTNEASS